MARLRDVTGRFIPACGALSRTELSDLWYAIAEAREAEGKPEEAEMARRCARGYRGKPMLKKAERDHG